MILIRAATITVCGLLLLLGEAFMTQAEELTLPAAETLGDLSAVSPRWHRRFGRLLLR
jgi:hypothetical protein